MVTVLTVTGTGETAVGDEIVDDELLVDPPVEASDSDEVGVDQLGYDFDLVLEVSESLHAVFADSSDGEGGAVFEHCLVHYA